VAFRFLAVFFFSYSASLLSNIISNVFAIQLAAMTQKPKKGRESCGLGILADAAGLRECSKSPAILDQLFNPTNSETFIGKVLRNTSQVSAQF
jgi:hypothetical protein